MVANVTGGKALPVGVLQQIVSKTDGVPLFVEELTKMVLESGLGGSSGAGLLGNYRITASLRNERRDGTIGIEGPTAGGEIRQGAPVLLLAAQ